MRLNAKIGECISVKKYTGDVGIEIEAELNKGIRNDWNAKSWQVKGDGSLRGNGYEFVLFHPIKESTVAQTVHEWEKEIKLHGIKLNKSERTSIHVHRNVQDFTVLEALNAICTYWLAEPYLLPFCGDSRKGNNFCLTLQDADGVHSQLIKGVKEGKTFDNLGEETYRYASLNIAAINRFGSLECRLMRGTDNTKEIINWSKAINQIIGAGKKFKNPPDLIQFLDKNGPDKLLDQLLDKELVQYFSGFSPTGNPAQRLLDNAMYIYEIAEAKKSWDFLKSEESLKKDFDSLLKLKLDYLTSLGYTASKETTELAMSLLTNDLKAKGVADFNKFLETPVALKEAAPPRRAAPVEIFGDGDDDDDEPFGGFPEEGVDEDL